MSAEILMPKLRILDDIEVPETVIEDWQVTVDLLAELAGIPAALIMRVHANEIEVFVSSHSPSNVYHHGEKMPLNMGLYCEKVMSTQCKLLVPNALKDPNWDHNPDIEHGMISYCGLPLAWPNGEIFGTICILDVKENEYTQQIHHLIARFCDSIQQSLANIHATYLARIEMENAQSLLDVSKARSQYYLDATQAIMVALDTKGCITMINRAGQAHLGYTESELLGQNWFATCLPQPEGLDILFPLFERIISGELEEFTKYENNILHKDGSQRLIDWRNSYFKNDQGLIIGTLSSGIDITERRYIENKWLQSEERFKTAADLSPLAIYLSVGNEQKALYINPTFTRLFGYTLNEIPTVDQWWPLAYPDENYRKQIVTEWNQKVAFALETQSDIEPMEVLVTCRDGSQKDILWGFKTCGEENWAFGFDLTERKQTEAALHKVEADLNHAQAVAHIGSWRIDISNNILEWSDETYRIFGVLKGTPLTYQLFLDIVLPADRERVDTAWQEALTGKPYDIEHRIIVGQNVKWVREQAVLEFDEHGSLISGFGTVQDITNIKSNQEALQHERIFLRQVIDAVPSVIFVKDSEGRFLLGNQALAQSYGTSTEDLIGHTEERFNPNTDELTRFYQNDLIVINNRIPKFIPDEKVTHVDGSIHWYDVIKIPLIIDDTCNKVLVVATDITERKLSAEALRLTNQHKDEFLAMLAHELRNPLAPIRNAVQLLKMQKISDPALVRISHIIDGQVSHMTHLLDDLLDVARLMHGKIKLNIDRIELADIINDALEISRPLIDAREQELNITLANKPLWIKGDRVRLAQVLSNLLNNAAKYTGKSGRISLNVLRVDTEVVIDIRDTGIGIATEILPHIFDLFTQADHSLAHSQGGLGIGLTLVRQLVELHDGTVTAISDGIGKGSLFTVRLPALPIDSSMPSSLLNQSSLPIPKYRILIVEDYVEAAESLMLVLELKGHNVEIADCGLKAIEQAQVFQPQVVLLDIGLPDLDGYEVARRLRTLPETQSAILIALTGYGDIKDIERGKSVGFNHHLLKPLDFEKLYILLASSLDNTSDNTECRE